MRTNLVIDDQLMNEALQVSGLKTKKEVIEMGLKLLIQQKRQSAIRGFKGKLQWQGDVDEIRSA